MFGSPVHIIEDVEEDLVVVFIFNCLLFLGYTIIWAHISFSKDTLGNVELKIHQQDFIILPKVHIWDSNECVDCLDKHH